MNSQEAFIMGKKPLMSIFRDNEVMLREGDTTDEMFKILSGKAALYLNFGKENEYFIGVLSEGKCFGEVSLLAGKPSPYTVVAVGEVMAMRVTSEQFEGFVHDNTKNAVDIMKNMALRIVMLNANLNLLADELSNNSKETEKPEQAPNYTDITRKIRMYQIAGLAGSFNDIV